MKQFTVVFPVARVVDKNYILLGEQIPGKPLAGYLNGYGGKVEDYDESILKAAERELREELEISLDRPVFIGSIVHKEKEVFFFLSATEYKPYRDTEVTTHNNWYDLSQSDFVSKMLSGDIEIIEHIRNNIENYFLGEQVREFKIEKEGVEIDKATRQLDSLI